MSWHLRRSFRFEAAHHLPHAGKGHPCERIHGHSYRVILEIRGDVEPVKGWVVDFDEIDRVSGSMRLELDHQLLNEVPGLENPTAELIAQWIYMRLVAALPGLAAVTVCETDEAEATYLPASR